MKPSEVFVHCDKLESLPLPNKENWLFELRWLKEHLPENARVLQVGCAEGTRIRRLLAVRPDLHITGVDIDDELLGMAKALFAGDDRVKILQCDITNPVDIGSYDWVLCLNHTLGYILKDESAIMEMKKLGKCVVVSVYGEKFTEELGREYFLSIKLDVSMVEDNVFRGKDFSVRRFTRTDVEKWEGEITKTPIGYLSVIRSP